MKNPEIMTHTHAWYHNMSLNQVLKAEFLLYLIKKPIIIGKSLFLYCDIIMIGVFPTTKKECITMIILFHGWYERDLWAHTLAHKNNICKCSWQLTIPPKMLSKMLVELTISDAATTRGVSTCTIMRDWVVKNDMDDICSERESWMRDA